MLGLLLLEMFVGSFIPYKERSNWVCTVSGSTRTEIIWFGCFKQEKRTASALEEWLVRKEPGFQPSWRHLSTQEYSIGGFSCATAGTPEVYALTPVLERGGIQKLSDDRIAALVEVLRHGSPDERARMIRSISDEVFSKN